jgi:hypothetical protein
MDIKRWIGKTIRIPLAAIIALGVCLAPGPGTDAVQALPPIPPVATFTVMAIMPGSDQPTGSYLINGLCPDAGAILPCTLREAVAEANAMGAVLPVGSWVRVAFVAPIPIDINYGPIVVGSNVVIQGFPTAGPLLTVALAPPGFPAPATPPPYNLFSMTGVNSEIYGLVILNLGPIKTIDDAISITGNNNLVDLNSIQSVNYAAIHVSGPTPTNGINNIISQNWLGIDPTGVCGPNRYGVHLDGGASNTTIQQNFISCNLQQGVFIDSLLGSPTIPPVSTTIIDSNAIGTDLTGLAAMPNVKSGILDYQGFTTVITNNVISGNGLDGITLDGAQATQITTQNLIGTDTNGAAALPNGANGIKLVGGTAGAWIGTDNVISGNLNAGISMIGLTTVQNAIAGNYFGVDITGTIPIPNGGLPVDLGEDGHTPNDAGDTDTGPNHLLNYPVITGSTSTTISGTVCSGCTVQIYQAFGNPAAAGGGGVYLARVLATGTSWTATLPSGLGLGALTFIAYDTASGDSSEMSPRTLFFVPMIFKP